MAESSLVDDLGKRFKAINLAITAQYDELLIEAVAWQESYVAACRENSDLQAAYASIKDGLAAQDKQDRLILDEYEVRGNFEEDPIIEYTRNQPEPKKEAWSPKTEPQLDGILPGSTRESALEHGAPDKETSPKSQTQFDSVIPGSATTLDADKASALLPMMDPSRSSDIAEATDSYLRPQPSSESDEEGKEGEGDDSVGLDLLLRPPAVKFRNLTAQVVTTLNVARGLKNVAETPDVYQPHKCFATVKTSKMGLKKGRTSVVDRIFSQANEELAEVRDAKWRDRFVVMPGSTANILWEFFGITIVLFDFVLLPLQFISDHELLPEFGGVAVHVMRIYWTLDIGMSFITAYYDTKTGRPEPSLKKIARRYAMTELPFDLLLVLSDWVIGTGNGERGSMLVRFFRLVRLLRLIRLLRFAQKILVFITLRVRSDSVLIVLELWKVFISCLLWTHPVACGFYGLGRLDKNGWIHVYGVTEGSIWSRYITSCNWSISQLTGDAGLSPQNAIERTYATLVLLLAFVLSALIISNLTTLMTRLQIMTAEKKRQLNILQMYLSDNQVSTRLATRILDYVSQNIEEQRRTPPEDMVELLQELSIPLQTELHFDIYSRYLSGHPFFAGYSKVNQRGMRAVCHTAVVKCKTAQGDVLFSSGESLDNPQMYMLIEGELEYSLGDTEQTIEPGRCVNEAVLWTPWPHQLGTLRAEQDGQVLCVQSIPFQRACTHFKTQTFYAAKYAQTFVSDLNQVSSGDLLETFENIDASRIAYKVFGIPAQSTRSAW